MIARRLHTMIAVLLAAITGLMLPASAGAYGYWANSPSRVLRSPW